MFRRRLSMRPNSASEPGWRVLDNLRVEASVRFEKMKLVESESGALKYPQVGV